MLVTLKVDVDVAPRWYRSAVDLAGVPGRAVEAKAQLTQLIAEKVESALQYAVDAHGLQWDRIRVHERKVSQRRVLRANKLRGAN